MPESFNSHSLTAGGAIFVLVLAVSLALFNAVVATCLALAFPIWMNIYLQREAQKQRAKFDRQFGDALQLISRSLRAGQPLLGAFQLVAEEMDRPVSTIFADIC